MTKRFCIELFSVDERERSNACFSPFRYDSLPVNILETVFGVSKCSFKCSEDATPVARPRDSCAFSPLD